MCRLKIRDHRVSPVPNNRFFFFMEDSAISLFRIDGTDGGLFISCH